MRFSVRTEKGSVGNWTTDFQGTAKETRAYLRNHFGDTPGWLGACFREGRFRVYGGEGSTRSRLGIRELRRWGLL